MSEAVMSEAVMSEAVMSEAVMSEAPGFNLLNERSLSLIVELSEAGRINN